MHIECCLCTFLLIRLVEGRSVNIFSDEEKEKCEDARKKFLTSTDRIMRNWHGEDVRKIVFEGDMVLSSTQKGRWGKTGYLTENSSPLIHEKWPKNTVNYAFSTPTPDKPMILKAMEEWSTKTCMKFAEGTGNVLRIFQGTGCYAQVGYHSKNMQMSVSEICDKGTVVHLLGHVIGLVHQHSRPDRDRFLHIQFHNTALEDVLFLNYKDYDKCPYDYRSVMHYDMYGLSYNGESVFLGRSEDKKVDGLVLSSAIGTDWTKPSDSDAALVNREYGCPLKKCSDLKPQPPKCNQDVRADQVHFERSVTFKSMMTDRHKAISCIWKTEVPETLPCSRAAISVTLSEKPDDDLKRVWFASGCRLFHVEIFDPDADMSYFYCAAQFARKATKVFVSTARKIYGIVRLYPADWEGFETAALETGKVKFFNIKDFVCAGEINGKCF
ncbi:high choriolytic enzyme 1-like [Pollicipes pollicipes]|uniref:high choriolytic enzyme 1-like n=1 Tax=Pollicipes pollicipes TaxID=41117 RepID=UPI001884D1B6|nr:high choriolytic enzyme 1-like [Pollicipes pollicipes]